MKKYLPIIVLLFCGTLHADSVTFTASSTWTCPFGVSIATVEVWAAGAGPRAQGINSTNGGGGGAYARSTMTVIPSTVYDVHIGSAGVGDATITFGGGDSWFKDAATILAKGGLCGNGASTGGSSALSIGDVKFAGGNGGARANHQGGGGGGSSAGSAAVGNNGGDADFFDNGGTGATAPTNGGNGGRGGNTDGTLVANGSIPGGAGGGNGDTGAPVSGIGAVGQIKITYTVSAASLGTYSIPGLRRQ